MIFFSLLNFNIITAVFLLLLGMNSQLTYTQTTEKVKYVKKRNKTNVDQ